MMFGVDAIVAQHFKMFIGDMYDKTLMMEYRGIVDKMNEAFYIKDDTEGQRLCTELQIIMKKVSEYFLRNQEKVRSQIGGTIMGGTCWKTFEEECIEKGMEKGQLLNCTLNRLCMS